MSFSTAAHLSGRFSFRGGAVSRLSPGAARDKDRSTRGVALRMKVRRLRPAIYSARGTRAYRAVMDTLFKDLRYGIRSLLKQPAFTLVAVGTVALAIGGNSAMFTGVNAVLLRPLAYAENWK